MRYLSYQYLIFVFLLFLIYYSVSSVHRWKVLLVGNVFFLICAATLIQILIYLAICVICFLSSRIIFELPQGSHQKRVVFVIAVSLVLSPFIMSRICGFVGGG